MTISRSLFALMVVANSAHCLAAVSIHLDFGAPVPGTLNDINGLGTGFTTRLPGTGSALPPNDPNMDLLGTPGKLLLTSTHAEINQVPGPTGNNLPILEAPSVFVPGVGAADLSVNAVFENVHVPNGSDHLMVYAGVDENLILRAGVHELNVYMLMQNNGTGDINTFSAPNSFTSGDTIEVMLSRHAGVWTLSWNNLTTATNGALPGISFPALDSHTELYFGVLASNPGTVPGQPTIQSFVAQIDSFSVEVVPEPASYLLWIGLLVAMPLLAVRRRV